MRLARQTSNLTIGVFAVFSAYLIFDRYFDNSAALNSPSISYAFPLMAASLVVIVYQKILRTGPPFKLGRIELLSKANIAAALFIVLLGVTSFIFSKGYGAAIQTQLFIVGTLAVLAVLSGAAGNLAYDALKIRLLQR